MTPTPPEPGASRPAGETLRIERLDTSYRFDDELAELLTRFQYRDDGIRLTAEHARPVPATSVDPATAGQAAVFEPASSLVFVCYDGRGHTMVNPIETSLIDALTRALGKQPPLRLDGSVDGPLGEGPAPDARTSESQRGTPPVTATADPLSLGVVTPHNAQRGALTAVLPDGITANTVEKYQGGERDVIAVSATVSDPHFARKEERFILNSRRLLVAISRAKFLTIVVCSTALFEVAPQDSERLDDGPIWARLFTQAVGRDATPTWAGSLGEFVGDETADHATVPVRVYPSEITIDGGNQ